MPTGAGNARKEADADQADPGHDTGHAPAESNRCNRAAGRALTGVAQKETATSLLLLLLLHIFALLFPFSLADVLWQVRQVSHHASKPSAPSSPAAARGTSKRHRSTSMSTDLCLWNFIVAGRS
mmetsp:Transcript_19546/g.57950  ORF Transcript_19546/g.57950 Transcript_19546/m.57950 type:complete len:124 (+) Transcript_19546:696-1067(+)